MKEKFIGGEYFFSPFIFFKKRKIVYKQYFNKRFPDKYYILTQGGYFSILLILKFIFNNKDGKILLPSYLCPTIIDAVKKSNINYGLYRVTKELKIDTEYLINAIDKNVKAVLIIKYFGFDIDKETKGTLKKIKALNIYVIEDIVQSFFSKHKTIGDYSFNSFRKYLPLDGSVILFNRPNNYKSANNYLTKYSKYKRIGQLLRFLHFNTLFNFENRALHFLNIGEKYYHNQSIKDMSNFDKFLFSRQNINRLEEKHKNNFNYLLSQLRDIAIYKSLPEDVVPLGFPILINNRDEIRKELIKKNIFCPIHWNLPNNREFTDFPESYNLSKRILTIPINENVDTFLLKKVVFLLKNKNSIKL